MKYTILDSTGKLLTILDNQEEAYAVFGQYSTKADFFLMAVMPIMTIQEYLDLKPDKRCFSYGRPSVVLNEPKPHMPRITYVYLIDTWDDYLSSGKRYADLVGAGRLNTA